MIEKKTGAGGLETLVLSEKSGDLVELVPERGAIVTRFRSKGEEVLFLDPATLVDKTKNVRGGVPVLFPIAGKLPEGRYEWGGKKYEMGQHGFGRNKAWRIASQDDAPRGPSVRLALSSDDSTRAVFPFDFEAGCTVTLSDGKLTVALDATNKGKEELPVQFGFHPYFTVPDAAKKDARLETKATKGFDNKTGKDVTIGAIDFTADEVDLHLADHGAPGTKLARGADRRDLRLGWSPDVKRVVLWTLKGKDFICVEPWTGPGGALAKNDPSLIRLAPAQSARMWMEISLA